MTLKVVTAALAEGVALDTRGNVSLVGFNPQMLTYERLPAQCSPAFAVALEDEEGAPPSIQPGRLLHIELQVTGTDGEVLFFAEDNQNLQNPKVEGIPPRVQLIANVQFTAAKAGKYAVTARFNYPDEPDGPVEAASRSFYVGENPGLVSGLRFS
jgi:hypothetical protein